MQRILWAAAAVAALTGCAQRAEDGAPKTAEGCGAGAAGVVVAEGWVRAAAADRTMSAGYVALCNAGAADDALVSATSPAAAAVEIHESMKDSAGVSTMRQMPDIALPRGAWVRFAPGGKHLMLIGLNGPLTEGQMGTVTLTFRSGAVVKVDLPVRAAAPAGSEHHH